MANRIIAKNAAFHFRVWLAQSADGITGATGLTLAVTYAKNADTTFTSTSPTVTELGSGHYDLSFAASGLSDTLGIVSLRATATGAQACDIPDAFEVVAYDPYDAVRLGLTALPNAAAEASGGLYTRGTGAGQINQDANGRVDANAKAWIGGTIPAVNVTGVPKVDLVDWLGSAPDALSSGKVAVDLKLWLATAPAAVTTNGYVKSAVLRWLTDDAGGTPDALSSGKLPADLKLWLTAAPAALSTNGYVQSILLRWLTDNAGGTPDALSSGKLPADLKLWLATAPASVTTNGYVKTTLLRWLTDDAAGTPSVLNTGTVQADVERVSNDTVAPANIALTFNGTGYIAATAPAQQQQVANIAVTSAALNQTAASRTITSGSGTGGVGNTTQQDGVYDALSDSAGSLNFYYEFDISGTSGAVGVGVFWNGYLAGVLNTLKVYAYNWGGSSWDQIGTLNGVSSTITFDDDWELTSAHTSTGLVRIRFSNTGLTSATLNTDRILLGYATPAPTAAIVSAAVWDQLRSGHRGAGSFGETLPDAAAEAAGGLYTRGSGAGQINQQSNGLVDTNVARWLNTAPSTPNVAGVPKVDVVDWLGSAPDALSSGKVPADLKLWLTAAPAALSTNGYVQGMLLRWLTDNAGGTPDALSSNKVPADLKLWLTATPDALSSGKVPADLKLWLTSAPATLSTNGYVQGMLLRWLTDNAGGTPDALSSGKLPADLKLWLASAPASLTTNGYVRSTLLRWLTDDAAGTPDALISGDVDVNVGAQAITPNVNVTQWLGNTPDALSSGKVPSDLKLWLASAPASLISTRVSADVGNIQAGVLTSIAGAVWDLATTGHATAGSFGELMAVIGGLHRQNAILDKTIFNGNKFMTSARLRVFASKAAADAANAGGVEQADGVDSEVYRFQIDGIEESIPGELKQFKMTRTL